MDDHGRRGHTAGMGGLRWKSLGWSLAIVLGACGGDDDSTMSFDGGACVTDADCDDGRACNGSEVSAAGSCERGAPLTCDDGVECTRARCVEALGRWQTLS